MYSPRQEAAAGVPISVRPSVALVAVLLGLGGCRARLLAPDADGAGAARVAALGEGAAPGDERGPGGFVPRGSARSFYAGAGGRLWYYLNNYYWAPPTAPREDLWIKAEVVESFRDLTRWPDGVAVASTEPKTTVEYWEVGPTGRSVRLDNHKDYCLLDDGYTAGTVEVRVTLTLGRVRVKDRAGRWVEPTESYVLESRNYTDDHGLGAERTRFEPLRGEAVTVWGYRIPWSTHPARVTRSDWQDLAVPTWRLLDRRVPDPTSPAPVTAGDDPATEARR